MSAFPPGPPFPRHAFDDVVKANAEYAASFTGGGLAGHADKGLAIVTCMDSRIAPLSAVGMRPGDAKILRNAGARVSDDVLRTLMLASYLLDVRRVLVMPHTECRMARSTEAEIHQTIFDEFSVDTRSLQFHTVSDQLAALRCDLVRIRSFPLMPSGLVVAGAMYDVHSGKLTPVDG